MKNHWSWSNKRTNNEVLLSEQNQQSNNNWRTSTFEYNSPPVSQLNWDTKLGSNAISVPNINQVVLELLKKNYGDYIKDNNGTIILYNNNTEFLIYNNETNKFILKSKNLFFTFHDYINSVNGKSNKYIIFKANNNYLIIDDKHIYLLLNNKLYVLSKKNKENKEYIIFEEIISNNTIKTISGLVNSNSNINDKDFLNFIGKLELEALNKNSINQYLKNLNEKYKSLSKNKQKLYEPSLIQKKKRLLKLSNSDGNIGSGAFIGHTALMNENISSVSPPITSSRSNESKKGFGSGIKGLFSKITNPFKKKEQ